MHNVECCLAPGTEQIEAELFRELQINVFKPVGFRRFNDVMNDQSNEHCAQKISNDCLSFKFKFYQLRCWPHFRTGRSSISLVAKALSWEERIGFEQLTIEMNKVQERLLTFLTV